MPEQGDIVLFRFRLPICYRKRNFTSGDSTLWFSHQFDRPR